MADLPATLLPHPQQRPPTHIQLVLELLRHVPVRLTRRTVIRAHADRVVPARQRLEHLPPFPAVAGA